MDINIIHNEDCITGMSRIEKNSIDMILTDPPYNINLIPQRGITDSIANDNMERDDFIELLNGCASEFKRVLKEDTFFLTFCGWSTIPEYRAVFDGYFELKSMPIWVKNNFGIGYYTRPQYEPCLLYLNGKPPVPDKATSDVWKFDKVNNPTHSCEKPVRLIQHILRHFSKPNDVVLDPFMGSGTTAVACLKTQRRFVGFELEQRYVDMANKRIKPWLQQISLLEMC